MPSYKSAEPVNREERESLLARVREDGYVDDYEGVRVDGEGGRFVIREALVWNLLGEGGGYVGQAAAFDLEKVEKCV